MNKESYQQVITMPFEANSVSYAEVLIESKAKEVWLYLLKSQSDWMTALCMETIEGNMHEEGELKRVTLLDLGEEAEAFYFKTLKIIPDQQFIYKAFTDGPLKKGIYDGYELSGYEMLTLVQCNRQTKVIFNALLGMRHKKMNQEQLRQWSEQGCIASENMWNENLRRLKSLVEGSKTFPIMG